MLRFVRWRNALLALPIVLATFVCYRPAWNGDFVFDDVSLVRNNKLLREPDGLARIWFSTEPVDYWPVSYTAFWIQRRLWGESPTGYRLTNLLWHSLTALVMWRILLRLAIPGAWLAALLFALHPVNVETAAWIFQQKTTLAALLAGCSLWAFLHFEQQGRRRWYALSVALFLLAMLAKSSVVSWPAIVLALAWWKRGELTWTDVRRSVPFFAVAAALGAVAVWFQMHRAMADQQVRDADLLDRLAGCGWAIWFYLGKAVWPAELSFVYPMWEVDGHSLLHWLPSAAWLMLAALCWRHRTSWGRHALAAMAYFTLALAPVLGLVDISYMLYSLVADHWQYLALAGPVVLSVAAGHRLSAWIGELLMLAGRSPIQRRLALACIPMAAVAMCATLTWRQSAIYRDGKTLWSDTVARNPAGWMPWANLGHVHTRSNKIDAAEACYRRAWTLKPDYPALIESLARVLIAQRKLDEALRLTGDALMKDPARASLHFLHGWELLLSYDPQAEQHLQRAVSLDPQLCDAHEKLGTLRLRQKDYAAANSHFSQALVLEPRAAAPRVGLAQVALIESRWSEAQRLLSEALADDPQSVEGLLQQGNLLAAQFGPKRAIEHLTAAVAEVPDSFELHAALGERLAEAKRTPEALERLQLAVRLQPNAAEPHAALGDLLATERKTAEAVAHYEAALGINPQLVELHATLGNLLGGAGRIEEAIAHYRAGLAVRPEWPAVSTNLAWLLLSLPSPSELDLADAVSLAEAACRQTRHRHPVALDTLAAAYAASGRWQAALEHARLAVQQAQAQGQEAFAAEAQSRLDGYSVRQARLLKRQQ